MPDASTVSIVASLTHLPTGEELQATPAGLAVLEVRADLVGEVDAEWVRSHFPGRLLYTLRSKAEGGAFAGSAEERARRLAAAGAGYDFVDLEGERDLVPAVLQAVPTEKRVVSWHGHVPDLQALLDRFERIATVPARFYKIVTAPRAAGEELQPLALLHSLERDDVLAFAMGEGAAWTRLVAPLLGARVVFSSFGGRVAAPGQPSFLRLMRDFGLPSLPPVRRLAGVVGNPVAHSLSPRLHNGLYRALGIPALYLPFHVESFGDFWLEVVESGSLEVLDLPLTGLSVTAPHKEVALAVAGAWSPLAGRVGSANTLISEDGVWEAETTDPEGVTRALEGAGVEPRGTTAAVVGCGGAGRAAAIGLALAGATVTLVNRGTERGEKVAAELGLPFLGLADFDPAAHDLVVNATSLGRDDGDPLPFDPGAMAAGAVVLDMAYRERPTELVERARERRLVAVDGREVLLGQAVTQFRLMTGRELPWALGRELLGLDRSGDSEKRA